MTRFEAGSGLLHEILSIEAKTLSTYEVMYRKIVSYVLIKGHAGIHSLIKARRLTFALCEKLRPPLSQSFHNQA
jgi:hypothetical protein